jgi:hypothetical protein
MNGRVVHYDIKVAELERALNGVAIGNQYRGYK